MENNGSVKGFMEDKIASEIEEGARQLIAGAQEAEDGSFVVDADLLAQLHDRITASEAYLKELFGDDAIAVNDLGDIDDEQDLDEEGPSLGM